MDQRNTTMILQNIQIAQMNASHSTVVITTTNLPIAILIMVSFLVGTAVNGVFLWVLGMKMKRTVNTTWFLHLILTYLLSCSLLPFFAVFVFFDFDWIFGPIMCKFLLSSFSLGMFTTVFLLTTVSLDRFLITCHSVWSRRNRTIPHAQRVIAGVWLASLVLSAPNFPFLEIREVEGKRKCGHEFRVHLAFFLVQFLLAFLFPFIIIMTCYCWIGCEMKKKRLLRTGKTFRVLVAVVASFFICWLPYHLYRASLLLMKESELIVQVLWDTAAAGVCFNICFTPILYLFVGEKFQEVFKRSIFAFLQGFADDPVSPGDQ